MLISDACHIRHVLYYQLWYSCSCFHYYIFASFRVTGSL